MLRLCRPRRLVRLGATFPEDPEAWSETLTPAEGWWIAGMWNNTIFLDRVNKASGEACVACSYDAYDVTGTVSHVFVFKSAVDLRNFTKIHFLHALQGLIDSKIAFTGECDIYLICDDSNFLYKSFGTSPSAGYSAKVWDLRTDFIRPDWCDKTTEEILSAIKEIRVDCYVHDDSLGGPYGQRSWIDRIYFSRALGTLTVASSPTGKTFTFDGMGYVTPHRFQAAPGDTFTVVLTDTEGFLQWEDGSTSTTRSVTIPEGAKTITAYYEGGEPPPAKDWTWLLATLGVVGTIVVVWYLTQ